MKNGAEKDHVIKIINLEQAKNLIEKYHYSKKVPTGKNIFFGWFINNSLYAVADYGIGVNSYQASFLKRITKFNVENTSLLELKRLVRIEPKKEKYPLTMFLSMCHTELNRMGYKFIISFSDPFYNHDGGIYKAANFLHLGKTNAEVHCIDENGNIRHRRYYFRFARRNNISVKEARKILKLTALKTVPKDRWFLCIDRKEKKNNKKRVIK